MYYTDLHMHTIFCDGKNTPEEMVLSGIKKGLKTIGITIHAKTEFGSNYACPEEKEGLFKAEINRLKNKYADKINVLCGAELDYFSIIDTNDFDYIIGSVHYIKYKGEFLPVDFKKDVFIKNVNEKFNGDYYAFIEEYYNLLKTVVQKTGADIIGHFDLVRKYNINYNLFDETNPRYVKAFQEAAKELVKTGKPFEINTGAISRGHTDNPYPSADAIKYIKELGGKFVLNSDSHSAEDVAFQFEIWEKLL